VAIRLAMAYFLFSLTVTALALMGASQSFTEDTLRSLFLVVRWLSWCGLLVAALCLVPWTRGRKRILTAVFVALGLLVLFLFVLVWGTWVYPDAGNSL
jgi:hypothetical protein